MEYFNSLWRRKKIIAYCLSPLSLIYRLIIKIRRLLYKKNILKTIKFNIPVIVAGNITVGGTGKTPLVIALAQFLKEQGYSPGIVSRGYGGKARHFPFRVDAQTDSLLAGDEPVLIAQQTQCPVYIAPRRVAAVKKLLAENACDVVISDDGLQHYALGRAIEIAVIDGERRFGNGFCLPAGPLREPLQRLSSVDFIVCNGAAQAGEYSMLLTPLNFRQIKHPHVERTADYFKNKTIHAVAGIGNPARFFNLLRELGLTVIEHAFPDHHIFKAGDFSFVQNAIVIMTEKDAVKCLEFADDNYWCLPVKAQLSAEFKACLLEKLKLRQ